MSGFRPGGKHGGPLQVHHRFPCGKYASELGLRYIGEVSQDLPHGPAQVLVCRHAVDVGKGSVDCEIAKLSVKDAEADGGRTEIGCEQLLRVGHSFQVRKGNPVARAEVFRITWHGWKPRSADPAGRAPALQNDGLDLGWSRAGISSTHEFHLCRIEMRPEREKMDCSDSERTQAFCEV
jgi:hypothetical protein